MSYRMKGPTFFNKKSPLKKDPPNGGNKVSPQAANIKITTKSKDTSKLQDIGGNISKTQAFLTKKHNIYKGKNLTLKGQVNAPKLDVGWDPQGSMTKYGGPTTKISNSANLSGSYKIGKNTTLSGGVNYRSGEKPYYTAGLNIKI